MAGLEHDRYVADRLTKPTYVVKDYVQPVHDHSHRRDHSTPHERALKKQAFR